MKFTCDKNILGEAVNNVQRAVAVKTTNPALEGILIKAADNKLTLCGYDLDIGITTTIEANVISEGEIVVKAKLFSDILRNLEGNDELKFDVDEKKLVYIECGKAFFQIVGIDAEEFTELPYFEQKDKIEIKADILKEMIRQTKFALAAETGPQKSIYTGALFEINDNILKIVALDGFKMAIRKQEISGAKNNRLIVPGKALNEIMKLPSGDDENISIIIGQRHIIININKYSVFSRLLEGNFVDYNKTIPSDFETEVIVDTDVIKKSVERMSLLNQDKIITPLCCDFKDGIINFSCANSIGKGNDSIEVKMTGEDVCIGFNHRYLLDVLSNVDVDKIRLEISGPARPMKLFALEGDDFMYVVLPMRLA